MVLLRVHGRSQDGREGQARVRRQGTQRYGLLWSQSRRTRGARAHHRVPRRARRRGSKRRQVETRDVHHAWSERDGESRLRGHARREARVLHARDVSRQQPSRAHHARVDVCARQNHRAGADAALDRLCAKERLIRRTSVPRVVQVAYAERDGNPAGSARTGRRRYAALRRAARDVLEGAHKSLALVGSSLLHGRAALHDGSHHARTFRRRNAHHDVQHRLQRLQTLGASGGGQTSHRHLAQRLERAKHHRVGIRARSRQVSSECKVCCD